MAKIIVIGSGYAGLSAACYLSAAGNEVHVFEKNSTAGGRARQLVTDEGYTFDMGPSWYWMPDVFEKFFADFGYSVSDLYKLTRLDPAFEIIFEGNETLSVPDPYSKLREVFECIEEGAGDKLDEFLKEAKYKYETGMENMAYMPGLSYKEFARKDLIKGVFRLQVFRSFSRHVKKYFKDPRLRSLMEFPVLFLGAMPQQTPALYSLMNYAGLKLGTFYPKGGFGAVTDAMIKVATENGTRIHFNSEVSAIVTEGKRACAIVVNGKEIGCDAVIASADYHHVEEKLLPPRLRNYSESYWSGKTLAPSCLIFYMGIKKELKKLKHHSLFFDEDFSQHSIDIYQEPKWPAKPLFYVCCPSKTDDQIAPEGHENLFMLMPLAPGLNDTEELREQYFNLMMKRLEKHAGEEILPFIDYRKSYCVKDFVSDYHSYKGNAYGLANTLRQTAILKPGIRNKKVKNLFYAGQLTVPGPGVPPSLISGKMAAAELIKELKKNVHEGNL